MAAACGLGVKSLDLRRRGQLPGQNHLHRDRAVQRRLPRLEDDPHSTAGNFLKQFVIAEVAKHSIGAICRKRERGSPTSLARYLVVRSASDAPRGESCRKAR